MRLRACQRLSRGSKAILHLFPWSQVTTVFRNNDLSGSITWELHLCFKAAFPKHQPSGQNVHKYTFESKEKVKISPTDTQRRKRLNDTGPQHIIRTWGTCETGHQSHFRSSPTGVAAEELQSLLPTQTSWRCPCPSYPAQGEPRSQWLLQITQHSRRAALPFLDSPGSSGQAGPAEESSVKPLQSSHVLWGIWPMVFLPAFSSVSY